MIRIVHVRHEAFTKYLGRRAGGFPASIFANPFPIGMNPLKAAELLGRYVTGPIAVTFDGPLDRDKVLECFMLYYDAQPDLQAAAQRELTGEVGGCWCKPREGFRGRVLCHGQVIAGRMRGIRPEQIT